MKKVDRKSDIVYWEWALHSRVIGGQRVYIEGVVGFWPLNGMPRDARVNQRTIYFLDVDL